MKKLLLLSLFLYSVAAVSQNMTAELVFPNKSVLIQSKFELLFYDNIKNGVRTGYGSDAEILFTPSLSEVNIITSFIGQQCKLVLSLSGNYTETTGTVASITKVSELYKVKIVGVERKSPTYNP